MSRIVSGTEEVNALGALYSSCNGKCLKCCIISIYGLSSCAVYSVNVSIVYYAVDIELLGAIHYIDVIATVCSLKICLKSRRSIVRSSEIVGSSHTAGDIVYAVACLSVDHTEVVSSTYNGSLNNLSAGGSAGAAIVTADSSTVDSNDISVLHLSGVAVLTDDTVKLNGIANLGLVGGLTELNAVDEGAVNGERTAVVISNDQVTVTSIGDVSNLTLNVVFIFGISVVKELQAKLGSLSKSKGGISCGLFGTNNTNVGSKALSIFLSHELSGILSILLSLILEEGDVGDTHGLVGGVCTKTECLSLDGSIPYGELSVVCPNAGSSIGVYNVVIEAAVVRLCNLSNSEVLLSAVYFSVDIVTTGGNLYEVVGSVLSIVGNLKLTGLEGVESIELSLKSLLIEEELVCNARNGSVYNACLSLDYRNLSGNFLNSSLAVGILNGCDELVLKLSIVGGRNVNSYEASGAAFLDSNLCVVGGPGNSVSNIVTKNLCGKLEVIGGFLALIILELAAVKVASCCLYVVVVLIACVLLARSKHADAHYKHEKECQNSFHFVFPFKYMFLFWNANRK